MIPYGVLTLLMILSVLTNALIWYQMGRDNGYKKGYKQGWKEGKEHLKEQIKWNEEYGAGKRGTLPPTSVYDLMEGPL